MVAWIQGIKMTIKWTRNGDKHCSYDNWLGETPLGRILITWKGWKEHKDACIDEFPGKLPNIYGDPDYVKEKAEEEFFRRVNSCTQSCKNQLQSARQVIQAVAFDPYELSLDKAYDQRDWMRKICREWIERNTRERKDNE
jgi:hypothetical protein